MKEELYKTCDESNPVSRPSYNSKTGQGAPSQQSSLPYGKQLTACASERMSSKQEYEPAAKTSKPVAAKLGLHYSPTTADLKHGAAKPAKQAVNASCNTSIMDYIKTAKSHWALQQPKTAQPGLSHKKQVHLAHLQHELKKTHKKLTSICKKEPTELVDCVSPKTVKAKAPAEIDTLLNHASLDQSRNDNRTFSRGSQSPKVNTKRSNVMGSRKVSIPFPTQAYYQRGKKVRQSIKKQLDFSPDSDRRDSSLKKGRLALPSRRLSPGGPPKRTTESAGLSQIEADGLPEGNQGGQQC